MNRCERQLLSFLELLFPGQWTFVGNGQLIVADRCPDFVHTSKMLLIEFFGNYRHREDEVEPRKKLFQDQGYSTLVVWEDDLLDLKALAQTLREFTNGSEAVRD